MSVPQLAPSAWWVLLAVVLAIPQAKATPPHCVAVPTIDTPLTVQLPDGVPMQLCLDFSAIPAGIPSAFLSMAGRNELAYSVVVSSIAADGEVGPAVVHASSQGAAAAPMENSRGGLWMTLTTSEPLHGAWQVEASYALVAGQGVVLINLRDRAFHRRGGPGPNP